MEENTKPSRGLDEEERSFLDATIAGNPAWVAEVKRLGKKAERDTKYWSDYYTELGH